MVQNQVVQNVLPTVCHQKPKKRMKSVKISKSNVERISPKSSQHVVQEAGLSPKNKELETKKANEIQADAHGEGERTVISLKEEVKRRRREERLAREKQAEEERERFVKEATERKAAEREEIIKQAKRFILYRKPLCRRINQGLLVSECFRELDAQIKFRETIKNVDKAAEIAYGDSIKEDAAKYKEEMKQKVEEQLKKRKNYAIELKKQIEENRNAAMIREKEELEAEKQDQINMHKYLQDIKEYEAQQLQNKKQKLKKFFNDAIEEKKQLDLELKHEEDFEDRANEIYRNAKLRIQKLHKTVIQKEIQEREQNAQIIVEKFRAFMALKPSMEEEILKKAQAEQEEQYQEKQRLKKERELQARKELYDFQMKVIAANTKQFQEEKDLKTWELVQRFKKAEYDKETEIEDRKQRWNSKMEYANSLKKYISEKEAERVQEKLDADEATDMKKIIKIENKKVLDYAEEVINESKGVRPLFPILKAVEECKKEMGLLPPKKREETIDTQPKRRQRVRRCTKFVPEDKIHYL